MQYDLTNNITSIGVKGSAIFGVFTDKNLSILAKHLDSSDIAKIKEIVTKTSFEGNVNQSICIYDSSKKNLEKIYLVGMGEKNKYSEKTFLKVINCFSAVCKKENIKNIFLVVDSLISKGINTDWAVRNISLQINGIDYIYSETKNKTKQKITYKTSKLIFVSSLIKKSYKRNLKKYFNQGSAISNGVKLAKKLGDLPSNICTPTYLAKTAADLGKKNKKMNVKIHNEKEMKKMGMNCLLSVGNGSEEP